MRKRGVRGFLISCIFWLLPSLAGGLLSAVFLCTHEYRMVAELAGPLQEGKTLPEVLKKNGNVEKDVNHSSLETGRAYLEKYGYRRFGRLSSILPFTLVVNLCLFEAAGCILFFTRKRDEEYQVGRIRELTEYLKAVDRGEAAVLTRHEDLFSHLEDEIYKTVAELTCTKERAVKDHEVLAARIADIAHQLKTPLTSMSLMAELLEPSRKEEQEYLERLRHQAERLKGLVEGLLALAKLDSHTMEFQREEIELEDLLLEASEPLLGWMDKRQISLDIVQTQGEGEDCKGIWIRADYKWTGEAILNVLKNCVEHTPDGGRIRVSLSQNPMFTEVLVEDGGTGISKKDLPHLFDRFYRGEKAAKDSAGIGLALSKLILEAQNGQISAENSPEGHAQFRMRLYLS